MQGSRLYAFSMDRLLYLWLHRLGLMGRENLLETGSLIGRGMTVVDVGANIGVYTAAFARTVGETGAVIALEPAPANLRALRKACQVNNWSNVEIHGIAAAECEGTRLLACSSFNSGNNALSSCIPAGVSVDVPTMTLDTLLGERRVDFLKIDVQGWEADVLRGATRILRKNRPLTVRLEIWPKGLRRAGSDPAEILEILDRSGLSVEKPGPSELAAACRGRGYFDITACAR